MAMNEAVARDMKGAVFVQYENGEYIARLREVLPSELLAARLWVCANRQKKPVSAVTGKAREWQKHLADFATAAEYAAEKNLLLGLCAGEDSETGALVVTLDIDNIGAEGCLSSEQAAVIRQELGGYCERSISGKGWHMVGFSRGRWHGSQIAGRIELKTSGYILLTGDVLAGRGEFADWSESGRVLAARIRSRGKKCGEVQQESGKVLADGVSVRQALQFIPADDYDTWIKIGMALHNGGHAIEIWDKWSATSVKYKGLVDIAEHWRSFGYKQGGEAVTLHSLYAMAQERGFKCEGERPDKLGLEYVSMAGLPANKQFAPMGNVELSPQFRHLTGSAKDLFRAMWHFARVAGYSVEQGGSKNKPFHFTRKTAVTLYGLGERAFRTSIKALEQGGFIDVVMNTRSVDGNLYQISKRWQQNITEQELKDIRRAWADAVKTY